MSFYPYITFSDSAKYVETAKNLIGGQGFTVNHSFFISNYAGGDGFAAYFSPLPSWFFSLIFRFFPATDLTVIITGYVIFAISCLLAFLIAKNLGGVKSAIISLILFLSSLFFYDYAHNATTETFFIFELLAFTYIILLPNVKTWLKVVISLPIMAAMFYTRQQFPLVAISALLPTVFLVWPKFSAKTKIFILLSLLIGGIATAFYAQKTLGGAMAISTQARPSSYIRGGGYGLAAGESFVSKVFYNLYNFAKSPERLTNPIILFLFIIFLFVPSKTKESQWFKLFSTSNLILFLFATSATLANARYVHPAIPLIIIGGGIGLKKIISKTKFPLIALLTTCLLITIPTIGYFTLDARAINRRLNINKPPVYKVIADRMAESIPQRKLIITNLDSWAAWYHGLTTMWFPLKPEMLDGIKDKVDYIVITNYLENDGDFSLGDWKSVVYSPNYMESNFLSENFQVEKTFVISPQENYQNVEIKGTILVKKHP